MYTRQPKELSDIAQFFLVPGNPTHRQYEALRAYFVEGLPSAEAAQRFGYSKGSFQVLCSKFRNNPHRNFFTTPSKGPKSTPKRDSLHDDVIKLRKQNLSVYDISEALN
jgi:transposase